MILATLIAGFTSSAEDNGAVSTALTRAAVIEPIGILKDFDLNFGNILTGPTGGSVILAPNGSRTPNGVVLAGGTVHAASFTVAGTSAQFYSIKLPKRDVILSDGNSHTMTVKNFTSFPDRKVELIGGHGTFTVGATLIVGANQAPGVYINTTDIVVTVNYE